MQLGNTMCKGCVCGFGCPYCLCYQPICNRWPNLKPSGRFHNCPSQHAYVCTFIVAHAAPRLHGLHMCDMCAMYTTQLAAERHVIVYREWKA